MNDNEIKESNIEYKTNDEIIEMVNHIFCFVKFKLDKDPRRKFEAIKAADGIECATEFILDLPTKNHDNKARLRDFLNY